jgi:hypothetical protein
LCGTIGFFTGFTPHSPAFRRPNTIDELHSTCTLIQRTVARP